MRRATTHLVALAAALASLACKPAPDRAAPAPSAERDPARFNPEPAASALVADAIPCGKARCDARAQYCEIYLSDVPDPPTDYECKPLPTSCLPNPDHPPACDCFPPGTPCLSFCGPLPTSGVQGFHLTCQGKRKPKTGQPLVTAPRGRPSLPSSP